MNRGYALLTVFYCAGLFWLSSSTSPVSAPPQLFPGEDKVAHAILYAGLGAVVSVGIRRSGRGVKPAMQICIPVAFACLYGLSDELHQLFVPGRHFELGDIAADTIGAGAAQVFLCGFLWRMGFRAGCRTSL